MDLGINKATLNFGVDQDLVFFVFILHFHFPICLLISQWVMDFDLNKIRCTVCSWLLLMGVYNVIWIQMKIQTHQI